MSYENSRTERYIKFVFKLYGKWLVDESKLKEYFLNNDSKFFISLVDEIIGTLPDLPNKRKRVISMRFGIGRPSEKRCKRSEIGKTFGLDDKKIQKIEDESFDELIETQENKNLFKFLKDLGLTLR